MTSAGTTGGDCIPTLIGDVNGELNRPVLPELFPLSARSTAPPKSIRASAVDGTDLARDGRAAVELDGFLLCVASTSVAGASWILLSQISQIDAFSLI